MEVARYEGIRNCHRHETPKVLLLCDDSSSTPVAYPSKVTGVHISNVKETKPPLGKRGTWKSSDECTLRVSDPPLYFHI